MSVSVVIAAYNVQECIPRALESAITQTLRPKEILVIDDGSTDNTREVVRNIARTNSNVRLVALSQNGGQARARNVGIQESAGNWIAILDADDAWKPERLERLLRIADEQPDHVRRRRQTRGGIGFRRAVEVQADRCVRSFRQRHCGSVVQLWRTQAHS
jgi:glycosyltransferase involved in cell wall biosynthesis